MYCLTILLDHTRKAEREALLPRQHRVSIILAQASCALERKLQSHCAVEAEHGRVAFTSYKPFLFQLA